LKDLMDFTLGGFQRAYETAQANIDEISAITGRARGDVVQGVIDNVGVGATFGSALIGFSKALGARSAAAALGGLAAGIDAEASYRAFQEGDTYRGSQRAKSGAIGLVSILGGPVPAFVGAAGGTAIGFAETRAMERIENRFVESLHSDIDRRNQIMGTAQERLSEYSREWAEIGCNELNR